MFTRLYPTLDLSVKLCYYLSAMKNTIHPQYFANAKVVCACGNTFTTGSSRDELHDETCANGPPFYTGNQHLIDPSGTIDKFKKKAAKSSELKTKRVANKLKAA